MLIEALVAEDMSLWRDVQANMTRYFDGSILEGPIGIYRYCAELIESSEHPLRVFWIRPHQRIEGLLIVHIMNS